MRVGVVLAEVAIRLRRQVEALDALVGLPEAPQRVLALAAAVAQPGQLAIRDERRRDRLAEHVVEPVVLPARLDLAAREQRPRHERVAGEAVGDLAEQLVRLAVAIGAPGAEDRLRLEVHRLGRLGCVG